MSSASWFQFLSVTAAAFGPAIALFITVLRQPVLIILTVSAAFLWICSITIVAAIWWALVPARSLLWLLVLYGVAIQEVCRWATYALFDRLMRGLTKAGLLPAMPPTKSLAIAMATAIAAGLGAGAMQTLVMYGDVLGGALRPGTLYTPACSTLSVFAVDALCALGFSTLNVLLALIGWVAAYPRMSWPLISAMVVLHLLASSATLFNAYMPNDGCVLALPSLFAVVLLAAALTAHVVRPSLSALPAQAAAARAARASSSD